MRNAILIIILVLALILGFGSVIYYNSQDYEYSLNLQEQIPVSEVFVTPSPQAQFGNLFGALLNNSNISQTPPMIQKFSVSLGSMSFENKGNLARIIELPRLTTCIDFSSTANFKNGVPIGLVYPTPAWPVYTVNEQNFGRIAINTPQIYSEIDNIYPQYNYGMSPGKNIELKKGQKLTYYISLKDIDVDITGTNATVFKNTKIMVYGVPLKNDNPLAEGYNYNSFDYNPTCDVLEKDFEPLKTIILV